MIVTSCALGVVQKRGRDVVDPEVVPIGPDEIDFLARHVAKVRDTVGSGGRSVFVHAANTPSLLSTLRVATSDAHFSGVAKTLQDALARAMGTTTTAKDCVFAAVRAMDEDGGEQHVTLLKLDAVVEAAQMRRLAAGMRFRVLKDLLPEPGKLQKALSWPDPRPSSDIIMLDTNPTSAQYFEVAYQVQVSPTSAETEVQLVRILSARVPTVSLSRAISDASELGGPLDEVLSELSGRYPELADAAVAVSVDRRPAGIVRPNKVAARRVVWKTDGLEVRVSPDLAGKVTKDRTQLGTWTLTIETPTEPFIEGDD